MSDAATMFSTLPAYPTDDQLLRLRCDSQSLTYYGDISAFISEQIPGMRTLSLLDIGPRTGSGLALLRLMHHPASFSRLKFDPVDGIDLDPGFELTATTEFPDLRAQTGDIAALPSEAWDIVVCSHTIEHIPNAEEFVQQIVRLARQYVVLACPFSERDLIPDHIRSIDYAFFQSLGFHKVKVYESHQWHNGLCCLAFLDKTRAGS
jgi:SAM-dependent methyltransferase